ncbi:hypothetical protein FisN_3Hh197 [Fistulifera solaris]|jgi:hypothetical protein|uniref:VOC domain-containing protein n=1 Tax=Fistulifera solaris TaxID=1519565 RepID=A0A1Z5JNV5_FISSO|nr:hypothetical protein FisN_3Hh197 [Fistulifera solaris]|eukprot:GAX15723.1 hypothetical protein FisN_3Hh197 [Fistulifera solaris]
MVSLVLLVFLAAKVSNTDAFAASQSSKYLPRTQQPVGNILILDHLNINHEKGRHDWLKAFYFDFLNCAVDPRKQENIIQGRKTLWANIGANQFHLPEGKPDAQVLNGVITLSYPNLSAVVQRYEKIKHSLLETKFAVRAEDDECLTVNDPWGNVFRIVQGDNAERDSRGLQLGSKEKDGLALRDLTIHTPPGCNMQGIARFYEEIMGAPILHCSSQSVVVSVGPYQTLTFAPNRAETAVLHVDLRDEQTEPASGYPTFPSNYGPHISLYLAEFSECYRKADALKLVYVNPRFRRQAYTLDQAIDDCMFRILDIVDPYQPEAGPILSLEHEVRSVVKRNGDKYGSCPFDEIPDACQRTLS